MFSLRTKLAVVQAFAPAAKTATANSASVDLAGFESASVLIDAGVVTDGTFTFKIQESTDNSTFTDVVAANTQLGAFSQLASGGGNGSSTTQLVDYIGSCRYIRVVMTVAGASTGAVLGVAVIKGSPRHYPAGVTQTP